MVWRGLIVNPPPVMRKGAMVVKGWRRHASSRQRVQGGMREPHRDQKEGGMYRPVQQRTRRRRPVPPSTTQPAVAVK